MKNLFSVVICLLVSVLWQDASAQQWIIDGQRVQSLEIHVSDPQAVYTDGSRQMTAPLPFASSVTATSGMLRASIPWAYDHEVHDFFMISETDQAVVLSSSGEIDLKIGKLLVCESGIYQTDEGTTINMEEHMLSGGWQIDEVLPYPEAIISRGFADGRYLLRTTGITTNRVIQAGNTLVISNGLITAILP